MNTKSIYFSVRQSAVFFCLAVVVALSGCQSVEYTDRNQLMFYNSRQDAALGNAAWQQIIAEEPIDPQSVHLTQLRRVGKKIAAASGHTEFQWEFYVLQSTQVNAFALPGGKVAFYPGIFEYFANDNELAVVMGHEIAHVIARHSMERQSQNDVQQLGAGVLGLFVNTNTSAGEALLLAYGVGTTLGATLPYSREHEYEADYIGMILMTKAGYDPAAAISFWKKFGASGSAGWTNFFSTHPPSQDRLERMAENLEKIRSQYAPR